MSGKHQSGHRCAKTRRSSRGYTVVEIIAAMTLFAIGAAGVVTMQRVTIQGGTDARRFDVGSNIANEWAHRLHRDSMVWTQPNAANPSTSNITLTRWLKDTPTPGATWVMPAIPAAGSEAGLSPAFDVYGRDVTSAGGVIEHMYCTQYRLQWLANPGPNFNPGGLIRAEIRVFWARLDSSAITDCTAATPDTTPTAYHFVYVSTAIRQNPDQ